jgi:hypothetical protein
MMSLPDAVSLVLDELSHSIRKHGDWSDYTINQMMSVIIEELLIEAGNAETLRDIHGDHGMIKELAQVAATSIKAMIQLSGGRFELPKV